MAHVIDYIELSVDDLEQSKAFYAKALGWSFNDYGPDYAGIQDPTTGGEFGGLARTPLDSRGDGVVALARTDDVDASLASVLDAGGRIAVAMHDYPGGRRFTFADPWGNVLGVYEPIAIAARQASASGASMRSSSASVVAQLRIVIDL